jgi:RES domain-containing protein
MTAIKEASQGLALKIEPLVLCSYEVDCEDIVDLTTTAGLKTARVAVDDLACGWMMLAHQRKAPPTWTMAKRLIADGVAGVIAPSFAPGASVDDRNLILWRWGPDKPHRISVHDPSGRLPKNQLSWP